MATASVAIVAAALGVASVAIVANAAAPGERGTRALLELLIIGVPLISGVYAMGSPRTSRFGLLLIAAGVIWSLTALGESSASLPYSIGRVAGWLLFPPLFYLLLSFPAGRLSTRVDRRLFGAITALVLVAYIGSAVLVEAYPLYTPWATCVTDCPANAFLAVDAQPAFVASLLIPVRETLATVLLCAVAAVLIDRRRRAGVLSRRALTPVVAAGVFSSLCLVVYFVVRGSDADGDEAQVVGELWALSVPGVAAGFLFGLLRRRAAAGDLLGRLSLMLAEPLDGRRLRDMLADELGDPDFEVLVPDNAPGHWLDTKGRSATRSEALAKGLAVTTLPDGGGVALVHQPTLRYDEQLFESICALVLATVQHQRTVARLGTSLAELEESRKRIARIADLERSRIERDLHDGAQQRLISLRIKVTLAEELARGDPVLGARSLHELGDDVELALEDLRALAHGVYPSLLTDRGLIEALSNAFGDAPLPVRFATRDVTRQAPEVETAVYFTCLEAVQNAMKHASGATGVWLLLWQGDVLGFEVRDDGPGFVPPARAVNGGLRNMRDRIEAVGGQLSIDSVPGEGTRICGKVPIDG